MRGPLSSRLLRAGVLLLALSGGAFVFGYSSELEDPAGLHSEGAPAEVSALSPPRAGPSPWEIETIRRATSGLPAYPGAVPRALGEGFLGAAAPISAAWFATSDSPEEVLRFYRAAILEKGLPVLEANPTPGSGYVGYFDPQTTNVELISVLIQGGQTLVFPSSGGATGLLEAEGTLPPQVPRPARLGKTSAFSLRHEGRLDHSIVAEVPDTSLAAVVGFYRSALSDDWRLELDEPLPRGRRFEASGARGRLSVFLRELGDARGVELFVRFLEPT